MLRKLSTILLMLCLSITLIGCNVAEEPEERPQKEPETFTLSANEEQEYIAVLEDMMNSCCYSWLPAESTEICSMATEEIIQEYIANKMVPVGMYEYFSGNPIPRLPEDGHYDNAQTYDPQNRYHLCYVLDAAVVDWILTHVFDRAPNPALDTETVYYYDNKVYVDAGLGGGPFFYHHVQNYEQLANGDYKLNILVQCEVPMDDKNISMIAKPNMDETYGKYWTIVSYTNIETQATTTTASTTKPAPTTEKQPETTIPTTTSSNIKEPETSTSLTKDQAYALAQEKSGYKDGQSDGDSYTIIYFDLGEKSFNGENTYAFQIRRKSTDQGAGFTQLLETVYIGIDTGKCYWESHGMTGEYS